MPTGYTYNIKNGITFEKFAMQCARGMGALMEMRDQPADAPIPERFEPCDYHAKKLVEAKQHLEWLQQISAIEAEREIDREHKEACIFNQASNQASIALRSRYQTMLDSVNDWVPPTVDHVGFKEFMAEQITSSMRVDCYRAEELPADPIRPTFEEWRAKKIERTQSDITSYDQSYTKEVERTEGCNSWIKALRDSFEKASA